MIEDQELAEIHKNLIRAIVDSSFKIIKDEIVKCEIETRKLLEEQTWDLGE